MGVARLNDMELLLTADQVITNSLASPVIRQSVGEYGYDAARFQTGRDLLNTAQAFAGEQSGKKGDQLNATDSKDFAREAANDAYLPLFKVAKIAVKPAGDRSKLKLDGDRERGYNDWLDQVGTFYEQALINSSILAALAEFNVTPEKLRAAQSLLEPVKTARTTQTTQIGSKQDATVAKNKALDDLEDWLSTYMAIAEIALAQHPQLLESLGKVVKSRRESRRESRRSSPPTEPPANA